MIKPGWFIGISAVLCFGILYSANAVPDTDPFSSSDGTRHAYLDGLTGNMLADLKYMHARRHGRFDVGLFGNSHSLNIGKSDLGIDNCSFFNFSIGSESLRSSVAYLERLAADGLAPRVAVVSVDHFELQRYNNPLYLDAPWRWSRLIRDLWKGLTRPDITLAEIMHMGWRHAVIEWKLFRQNFQVEVFLIGLKSILGVSKEISDPAWGGVSYRPDGSRPWRPITQERQVSLLTPVRPQILFGYLRYDLERLKRLQDKGTRVILFESLIEPRNARHFAANPSPYAAATRTKFLSLCGQLSLACFAAPADVPFADLPWRDHNHPPAKSTAAHLNKLLAEDAGRCKRDL